MPKSGFCNVCYGRVWVTHDGGCARGHAPYAVSDLRETDPGAADAPAGPPPAFFEPSDEAAAVPRGPVTLTPAEALELARIPESVLLGEEADLAGDTGAPSETAEVPVLTLPETEWVPEQAPDDATLETESPGSSGPDAFFGSEADGGGLPPGRPFHSDDTFLEPQVPASAVKRAQQLGQLAPLAVFGVCMLCYLLDTCARL